MRSTKLTILICALLFTTPFCHSAAQSFRNESSPAPAPYAIKSTDTQALCSRVSEIKHLPIKGEPDDPVHIAILKSGEAVLPCLIERVADSTPMKDPRMIPGPTDTRVGDVAYFLIVDIGKLGFVELLPAEVQEEYKTAGVFAYHRFVNKHENRLTLQQNLKRWYEEKYAVK